MIGGGALAILLLTLGAAAIAGEPLAGDTCPARYAKAPDTLTRAVLYPIRFFARTLSRADGDRCPMYPSCSAYSLQAFEKHGFLMGWIMTSDRLLRCGRDELKRAPWVRVNTETRSYDPVSANDGWWAPR